MRRVALSTLLAAVTLAGCSSGGSSPGRTTVGQGADTAGGSASSEVTAASACRTDLTPRPLPTWADTGFEPPTRPMPYVMGAGGDIVAILWRDHDPLVVPPARDRSNKILWVARPTSGAGAPLRIRATLAASGRTTTREVDGGPGPSVIDLPAPGCWSFELTWGTHHDHLQLEYAPR